MYTTLRIGRSQLVKTYIAVFACFASKAVQLEALSDLFTETFLFKQVYWQKRLTQNTMVTQRPNCRQGLGSLEQEGESPNRQDERNSRKGVQIHSSALGSGGKVGKTPDVENQMKRESNVRRSEYRSSRRKDRFDFSANNRAYRAPE